MIDAEARPTRRHRKRYYPCSVCHNNQVSKKGGRCKWCACKIREENYKKMGIRHPANRKFGGNTCLIRKRRNGNGVDCAAHWMIGEGLWGKCSKCDFKNGTSICEDTSLPCPHSGVRDFATLQDKLSDRFDFLDSCKKGGEKSGKLRGGRRGRPRKIREALE